MFSVYAFHVFCNRLISTFFAKNFHKKGESYIVCMYHCQNSVVKCKCTRIMFKTNRNKCVSISIINARAKYDFRAQTINALRFDIFVCIVALQATGRSK